MIAAPVHQPDAVCAANACTRPPAGGLLCAADADRLGQWLAQLGAEYELLSADPSMQARDPHAGGSGGSLASHRAPARLDVLTLTDRRTAMGTATAGPGYTASAAKAYGPWCLFCSHDTCTAWRAGRRRDIYDDEQAVGSHRAASTFGILNGWAEAVREGRDLTRPVRHVEACRFPCMHRACVLGIGHAVPAPLTVATERKLLAAHLDWVLAQDWAGEFHDEIRGLWGALRRANGHAAPARRVHRLETPCPGCSVRALTHRPGTAAVTCENCGHTETVPELQQASA